MMLRRLLSLPALCVMLAVVGVCLWQAGLGQEGFRLANLRITLADLILAPLLICLVVWLLNRIAGRLGMFTTNSQALDIPGETEGPTPEQTANVEVCDLECRLPAGDDPEAILSALIERHSPGFHPSLKTADGLPLRAAWIPNLITADFHAGEPEPSLLDTSVQRALLLAIDALQSIALRHFENKDSNPVLHIHFLAPARWAADTVEAADHWLRSGLASSVLSSMPYQLSVRDMPAALDTLTYLNELISRISTANDDACHALLAADSLIGPLASSPSARGDIEQLEDMIRGEGACVLLLRRPPTSTTSSRLPRIGRAAIGQSHAVADDADDPLYHLIDQSLGSAKDVEKVFSDAGRHDPQRARIARLQGKYFPQLHPIKDCLALTATCGEIGAVAPIALLALAAHLSMKTGERSLVAFIRDEKWRAAALVVSHTPEASPAHAE